MSNESAIPSQREKIDDLNQQAWDIRVTDSSRALLLSQEAAELAKSFNYNKGIAEGLRTLGFSLIRLSKNEEALTYLKEAHSLFESLGDLKGLAAVNEYIGIIHRNWGDFGASLEFLFKALALSQQTGFSEIEAENLYQIGVTYKHLGNYEKALDNLYKSLSIGRAVHYILLEAYAINVIGSIYFENEDYVKALEYYHQGLIIRQQSGDKWGEAGSLDNIGSTHIKLGAWEQAIDFCSQSLAISQHTGDKKGQSNALLHLAEVYRQQNDLSQATKFCNESLQIRQSSGDKKGEAEILLFLADLHKSNYENKEQEVFGWLSRALKIAEEIKATDLLAKTRFSLYEWYKVRNNYGESLNQLELYSDIEKELHKDAINQKILNREISHKAEESRKEAEIFRLRNVELAGLYEESKRQKAEIEEQKKNVEETLAELRTTQAQLIQSEKMASLGELTAGIAHEIQNPLNFVNNFSEVNTELIKEMKEELQSGNTKAAISIANDIGENEQKINHHGKRADGIVKGMLQHTRSSSGVKQATDINALVDEYLRLAYHGLRAKDKSFHVTIKKTFDDHIGTIHIVPQDMGRAILNLITNAFYAVTERRKTPHPIAPDSYRDGNHKVEVEYEPIVSVSTKKIGYKVEVRVKDNGHGISPKVMDKIFQPFFTTKPTGQGTGLGLSLSYDIIKAHGGEIMVESKEGEGAEFVIRLS